MMPLWMMLLLTQDPQAATPLATPPLEAVKPAEVPKPPDPPKPEDLVTYSKTVMIEKGGQHKMSSVPGTMGTTYAFVTVMFYNDFPGESAELHIKDPQPALFVECESNPRGRIFLVKAKKSRQGRSVKMGRSGFGSVGGVMAPDPDWTLEFKAEPTSKEDVWKITPKESLPKGEYGLFMGAGVTAQLFDFAED